MDINLYQVQRYKIVHFIASQLAEIEIVLLFDPFWRSVLFSSFHSENNLVFSFKMGLNPILKSINTSKDYIQSMIIVPRRELVLQTSQIALEPSKDDELRRDNFSENRNFKIEVVSSNHFCLKLDLKSPFD